MTRMPPGQILSEVFMPWEITSLRNPQLCPWQRLRRPRRRDSWPRNPYLCMARKWIDGLWAHICVISAYEDEHITLAHWYSLAMSQVQVLAYREHHFPIFIHDLPEKECEVFLLKSFFSSKTQGFFTHSFPSTDLLWTEKMKNWNHSKTGTVLIGS